MRYKIVALLVALICVFSSLPMASAFDDIAGLECEQDVRLLSALGIVEGKSFTGFSPGDNLTRAEMVAILLRTMAINEPRIGYEIVFSDVSDEYWAYYEIAFAYKMGIINGVGDRLFAPEKPVTYNQAIKMIVMILGHEAEAEMKGGYPTGYYYVANKLDLLDGVDFKGDKDVTRGEMAILVSNALNADCAQVIEYGHGWEKLSTTGTLLNIYLDMEKIEGRVNANYYQSISGLLAIKEDEVIIGETTYKIGDSDVGSLLGENIEAYVKEFDGDSAPTVLFASASKGTSIVSLTSEDLIIDGDETELTYISEEREETIDTRGFAIYVNGIEKNSLKNIDLLNATIKVIENKNDDGIILIDSFVDKTLKSVSNNAKMMYFEDGSSIYVKECDRFLLVNSNGEKIEFYDVSPMNIVSYWTNERNGYKVFKGIVSETNITGMLSQQSSDGSYTELAIDENVYKVSSDVYGDIPKIGTQISAYLNHIGHIAAIDTSIPQYKYGYLTGINIKKHEESLIRIFTDKGSFTDFKLAEQVKVNDDKLEAEELESVPDFYNGGTFKKQLVRYELNSEEEVKSIVTAPDDIISPSDRAVFGKNYYVSERGAGRWLDTFATRYVVDANTLYFTVPTNEDAKDKDYSVTPVSSLARFDSYVSPAYFYDIDENNVIGVILQEVVRDSASETFDMTSGAIAIGVVKDKKTVYSEENGQSSAIVITSSSNLGENVVLIEESETPIKMNMSNSNAGSSVITTEKDPYQNAVTIPYDAVDVGDVMMFKVDSDNVAYDAQMLARAKYLKTYESLSVENPGVDYSYSAYYYWASSVAKKVTDLGVIGDVNIYSGGPYERMFLKTDSVIIYDSSKEKLIQSSYADIQPEDRFVMTKWSIYPSFFVVYR